jgi:hypothetical protein
MTAALGRNLFSSDAISEESPLDKLAKRQERISCSSRGVYGVK